MRDRSYESSIAPTATLSYPRTNADEGAAIRSAEFASDGGFKALVDKDHQAAAQAIAGGAILELVELDTAPPRPDVIRLTDIV